MALMIDLSIIYWDEHIHENVILCTVLYLVLSSMSILWSTGDMHTHIHIHVWIWLGARAWPLPYFGSWKFADYYALRSLSMAPFCSAMKWMNGTDVLPCMHHWDVPSGRNECHLVMSSWWELRFSVAVQSSEGSRDATTGMEYPSWGMEWSIMAGVLMCLRL